MKKQDNFFLCHPDEKKSCAACCGLYNFLNHSKEFITEILRERKKQLKIWGNNLSGYRQYMEERESQYVLFPTIYTCPFLTFLDEEEKKVGCYLHPVVNNGRDLRDVAFYGSKVCNEHRCVSYFYYDQVELEAIVRFTEDWYLYGMVLHDIDFVKSFFGIIENGITRKLKISDFDIPEVGENFKKYFQLKENWPFKANNGKILDKYEFFGKEFRIRKLNTFDLLGEEEKLYKILRSLESEFKNKEEVEEAIKIVENLAENIVLSILNKENSEVTFSTI